MIAPGAVLAGKYQVERVLGQGGMGVVVSAHHLQLGQRVALKFLLSEAMHHPEAVERFLREARAAVRLRSEHVGRVIDVGTLDTGAPYMVMEFLEGTDLAHQLETSGPLPVAAAVDYALQACEAIAEAHSIGIIHRDLKPANLFVTRRPDGSPLIKVLDFGIAKATRDELTMTRTATVMGSPGYMSPEQLRSSRDVDARSDLWSLGVILYQLVSGRVPFNADTITDLAIRVTLDPTPQLPPVGAAGFETVIYRCLEKDPARRYQNVAELAAALAPFGPPGAPQRAAAIARVLNVAHAAVAPVSTTGVHAAPTTLGGAAGTIPPARRSRVGLAMAGVGVAIVAVVGVVVLASGGSGSTSSPGRNEPAAEPTPNAGAAPPVAEPAPPLVDAAVEQAAAPVDAAAEVAATPVDAAAEPATAATGESSDDRRRSRRTRDRSRDKPAEPHSTKPDRLSPPAGDDDVESSRY